MCYMLFLGSNRQCRAIPWHDQTPSFHVSDHDAWIPRVCQHFSKRYVYYVGSDSHCGCGFRDLADSLSEHTGVEVEPEKAENHRHLHEYVTECLQNDSEIQLYFVWDGEEAEEAVATCTFSINQLAESNFYLPEKTKIVVAEVASE